MRDKDVIRDDEDILYYEYQDQWWFKIKNHEVESRKNFRVLWEEKEAAAQDEARPLHQEHDDRNGYFDDDHEGMITGYNDRAGVYPTFLDSLYASAVDHHQVCYEKDPSYEFRDFIDEDDHEGYEDHDDDNDDDDDDDDFEKIVRFGDSTQVFNVDDFGAKGDDQNDDSEAFKKAWDKACSSRKGATAIVVPKNKKYLLKPLKFSGPCKSIISLRVYGTIEASTQISDYSKDTSHWLVFQDLNNFTVTGGGTINGNGEIWWKNSCKIDKSRAMTFYQCNSLKVRNIHVKNAQQMHVSFQKCNNVQARNIVVTAPGKSPNTDGIHVTATQDIRILNTVIGTAEATEIGGITICSSMAESLTRDLARFKLNDREAKSLKIHLKA
ncbi:hypothetical protein Syun_002021 [Stephania yunnanensis]|uniref:Polygalacturonase n=1 Tax=Stephania yunnanensis TaxID=152371 RepID=A0AAP0LF08_9MAGN